MLALTESRPIAALPNDLTPSLVSLANRAQLLCQRTVRELPGCG